jgi:very-short-patch-repair endonuclease
MILVKFIHILDIVKSSMKKRSGTYGKTKETLPLEGGGKRVGVKGLTGVARRLRKHSTDTEGRLWRYLRDRQIEGFKFRRQQPVGSYVVDFVNLEKKVVIELDGGQHALHPGDRIRDEWLRAEGYKVLRFWDNQVFSNLEGVLEDIRSALLTPHPYPLPQGERGDNF